MLSRSRLPLQHAHRARLALATAALALPAAPLAAPTAGAVTIEKTLQYTCNFPLMVPQPLTLHITSDIPESTLAGESMEPFEVTANASVSPTATKGLRGLETATLQGTATASVSVALPGGGTLPVRVYTTIDPTAIPESDSMQTTATGSTPALTFDEPGDAVFTL
ncbi:MAG: hypothetical protein QM679_11695, partial [Patulibacter sp.]